MGIFSAIGNFVIARRQHRLAKKINPVNTTYADSVRSGGENPYIQSLYGQGRNMYQGRMAGAGTAEQTILSNQANTLSSAENNATDSSQVLALGAGAQGQTDSSLSGLAVNEGMDKQRRFGAFSDVSQLMAQEGDKVYQDKLRRYYDDLNYKRALEGASTQNVQSGLSGVDSTIGMVASLASGGLIGGGRNRGGQTSQGQVKQPYYGYNPRTGGYYTD